MSISIDKLKKELEDIKTTSVPVAPIVDYLITKCNDDEFSQRVMLERKSLKECLNYVYSEVKKKLNGVSGWVADEEVYKIAEDYFILDIIKIETQYPERPNPTTEATEANDEKDLAAAAVEEVKVKEVKLINIPNKKEKIATILQEKQVSLFDF